MRPDLLSSNGNLDRIFQALSDPTRRALLRRMCDGEQSISDLAGPFDLTFAAVSKHLKVLESASLVARRKHGSFQMISLKPEALKPAGEWLAFYEHFWSSRLTALKTLLERPDQDMP